MPPILSLPWGQQCSVMFCIDKYLVASSCQTPGPENRAIMNIIALSWWKGSSKGRVSSNGCLQMAIISSWSMKFLLVVVYCITVIELHYDDFACMEIDFKNQQGRFVVGIGDPCYNFFQRSSFRLCRSRNFLKLSHSM